MVVHVHVYGVVRDARVGHVVVMDIHDEVDLENVHGDDRVADRNVHNAQAEDVDVQLDRLLEIGGNDIDRNQVELWNVSLALNMNSI